MSRPTIDARSVRMKSRSISNHINSDLQEFSDNYNAYAPPVGLDMAGHDMYLRGAKVVMLDSFVVDLLNVDTSAQTFRIKLLLNMDWEDDGTIEPEVKTKRNLGKGTMALSRDESGRPLLNRTGGGILPRLNPLSRGISVDSDHGEGGGNGTNNVYKTGKYVLKREFSSDPLGSTWNPNVVLVNAIADEDPIEAGSKFHGIQMLSGRPVISRTVLYQPECRCEFTFSNFPFDETDLVVKFSSNKWNSEQVQFMWTNRLASMGRDSHGRRISSYAPKMPLRREASYLRRSVDKNAVGGVGLSEFEIIKVRVETDEKDVNSMQRYDDTEGAFSEAHLIIRVRRDPYSYLLRVASVAELLMFLEVLSFMTDNGDLSARFSISGTIFLAMVSLYGPMADALPKVSVVTRVDKWHLQNFFLLFASNVENLLAFMLRSFVNIRFMEYTEALLGILYLYFVVQNLIWFVDPLKERDEYTSLVVWFEDTLDMYKDKVRWVVSKVRKFVPFGSSLEKALMKVLPWLKKEENSKRPSFTTINAAVKFKRAQRRSNIVASDLAEKKK